MTIVSDPPVAARKQLQAATADKHERLDQGFASLDLRQRGDYTRFLQAQAAVVAPLEDWLKVYGIARFLPDWQERRRGPALAADLFGLDASASPQAIRMRPPSAASLLGVAYVLEGSRLGAAFLARSVAGTADDAVISNRRFLTHGHQQGFWPSFLGVLESHVLRDDAVRDATEAARRTFDLFLTAQQRFAPAPVTERP